VHNRPGSPATGGTPAVPPHGGSPPHTPSLPNRPGPLHQARHATARAPMRPFRDQNSYRCRAGSVRWPSGPSSATDSPDSCRWSAARASTTWRRLRVSPGRRPPPHQAPQILRRAPFEAAKCSARPAAPDRAESLRATKAATPERATIAMARRFYHTLRAVGARSLRHRLTHPQTAPMARSAHELYQNLGPATRASRTLATVRAAQPFNTEPTPVPPQGSSTQGRCHRHLGIPPFRGGIA
jgi:hypothetical protein